MTSRKNRRNIEQRKAGRPRTTWRDKLRQDLDILGVDKKTTGNRRRKKKKIITS